MISFRGDGVQNARTLLRDVTERLKELGDLASGGSGAEERGGGAAGGLAAGLKAGFLG